MAVPLVAACWGGGLVSGVEGLEEIVRTEICAGGGECESLEKVLGATRG